MGRGIILVRHAMPEVAPGVAPALWGLSEPAGEDCVLVAHALPAELAPSIHTSGERKAEQTAAILGMRLGLTLTIDPRLGEVDRPGEWVEDHRAMAAAYLAGTNHPGWEPRDAVVARFATAVGDALVLEHESAGDIVVVNHGMALSLYLAHATGIETVTFWQALTFPDAWRFDLGSGELTHLYSGASAPDA